MAGDGKVDFSAVQISATNKAFAEWQTKAPKPADQPAASSHPSAFVEAKQLNPTKENAMQSTEFKDLYDKYYFDESNGQGSKGTESGGADTSGSGR